MGVGIRTENLRKVYETPPPMAARAGGFAFGGGPKDKSKKKFEVVALEGVSFEIGAGEIFGLLGPNGAGKTTTVEILEGYRSRDGGSVSVLGEDPQQAGLDWRERIGVVLQSSAMYPNLTVVESVALFAGYYA